MFNAKLIAVEAIADKLDLAVTRRPAHVPGNEQIEVAGMSIALDMVGRYTVIFGYERPEGQVETMTLDQIRSELAAAAA